jgi:S-adenosylmethionine-diacylglycerol 3-amino-3-carboxypropyl transferase
MRAKEADGQGPWFNAVWGRHLVYNACWEDPRLDRAALDLSPDESVLVITSAGCNALDYVLLGPREVLAVDLNPRQNALLELKRAAIRELEFDDFFSMFGRGRLDGFGGIYSGRLRGHLSPDARRYWDRHIHVFSGRGARPSFYFNGTTGLVAWTLNVYIDRVVCLRRHVDRLLDAASLDEQRDVYEAHVRARLWRPILRGAIASPWVLALLGVPGEQRHAVERDHGGGITAFVENAIEYVFTRLPLADNYFWRVYLKGAYTEACCPEYLKRENFERLKGGLVDRIAIHTASVAGFLRRHGRPVSRFVLLDHMDWLARSRRDLLTEEWQAIVERAAPGARVLWRSGASSSDAIDALVVGTRFGRRRVGDLLRYQRELAARLHALDRVHTYGSFHIADLSLA